MDAPHDGHPDEGTIHAWLDGALDAATAAAIDAHVASCTECGERAAEARGLIAGASRIVASLDDTPAAGAPAWGRPKDALAVRRSAWSRLRMTPARAAIAATIVVALGITLTRDRTGPDSLHEAQKTAAVQPPIAGAPADKPKDALLDSAIARNLAKALPRRELKAVPGVNVPAPTVATGPSIAATDTVAPRKVAIARSEISAAAETTAAPADRATAQGYTAAAAAPAARGIARAAKKADAADLAAPQAMVAEAPRLPAAECYRVESASGAAAAWGSVRLPFIVSVDSLARSARLFDSSGVRGSQRVSWARHTEDSLSLALRSTAYEGTLDLGAGVSARPGIMRSVATPTEVAVGAVSEQRTRVAARRKAASPPAPATRPAAAPATAVVARRVACPAP